MRSIIIIIDEKGLCVNLRRKCVHRSHRRRWRLQSESIHLVKNTFNSASFGTKPNLLIVLYTYIYIYIYMRKCLMCTTMLCRPYHMRLRIFIVAHLRRRHATSLQWFKFGTIFMSQHIWRMCFITHTHTQMHIHFNFIKFILRMKRSKFNSRMHCLSVGAFSIERFVCFHFSLSQNEIYHHNKIKREEEEEEDRAEWREKEKEIKKK